MTDLKKQEEDKMTLHIPCGPGYCVGDIVKISLELSDYPCSYEMIDLIGISSIRIPFDNMKSLK